MVKAGWRVLRHELLLSTRTATAWLTPLLFFVIVVSIFPLALGPDSAILQKCAPAIIWIAVLLSVIISLDQLFLNDVQHGYLDILLLSPWPLAYLVLIKLLGHWLLYCLPLILLTPILGLMLHLPLSVIMMMLITLMLGTPTLILLGAIGAALTVGVRGHGLLLPVLIMPLYIPVLIFATGTIMASQVGLPWNGSLAILAALFLISLVISPSLIAAALRIGVN